ncbi:MAG: cytochrome c, partial [Acidobacteriota bacterium]
AWQAPAAPPSGAKLRPISSIDGKDLYAAYCAQCHGAAGKGDGPSAAGLKTPVPDLTQIAVRNGGKFNRTSVARFISGDRPGSVLKLSPQTGQPTLMRDGVADEMPVWGTLFRIMWKDEPSMLRCANLAKYLEKIQVR